MKIILINAMWCNGCIVMHKVWNKVKEEYPNIEYVKYDYDIDEEEVLKYNVGDTLPVAIFYVVDNEVCRLIGEKTKEEIIDVIKQFI